MRVCNADSRLSLVVEGRVVDVERLSGGALPADPAATYERWAEGGLELPDTPMVFTQTKPPAPRQFGLGKSFPGFGPTGPVRPRKLIGAGDELVTYIEGIGSMSHRFVAA